METRPANRPLVSFATPSAMASSSLNPICRVRVKLLQTKRELAEKRALADDSSRGYRKTGLCYPILCVPKNWIRDESSRPIPLCQCHLIAPSAPATLALTRLCHSSESSFRTVLERILFTTDWAANGQAVALERQKWRLLANEVQHASIIVANEKMKGCAGTVLDE